jgi:hypothetical protein
VGAVGDVDVGDMLGSRAKGKVKKPVMLTTEGVPTPQRLVLGVLVT